MAELTTPLTRGTVVAVSGQIAQVQFSAARPAKYDVLRVVDDPKIVLEVTSSAGPTTFFCFILNPEHHLVRGTQVENTEEALSIPVGDEVLGRVFDIFAEPHDDLGPITSKTWRPLFAPRDRSLAEVASSEEIIETGIKPIDFFTPIVQGGKTAFVGGAGVGKTVILTAIMNRLVVRNQEAKQKSVAVFSAVGERSREAQELRSDLQKARALDFTSLILGQMGENPALRFRTAYAGATIAEHFRDSGKNVLFFMDNMYRFAQAGHELATLIGQIPSEDGYQPTLASEMAQLTERLISTDQAHITSFLATFVPSDDLTDYGVRSLFPYLDSMIILSRDIFQAGRMPAIDLLRSVSSALNPRTIGQDHYTAYIGAKQILEKASDLERIVSLVGEAELSQENQQVYRRAQLITNFMTQDLFTGTTLETDVKQFIPREVTVQSVAAILSGKYDSVNPEEMLYIGTLDKIKLPEETPVQPPVATPVAATTPP